jgi:GT2 family glycosyltransferase
MKRTQKLYKAIFPVQPDLSVIIVNWNTRELLAKSLASVFVTIHKCSFEVIVVDNGSTDGSSQMVREQFPEVHLIENQENLGFARANNQAIRQCRGDFVLLLNSDAFLMQGAVDRMMELSLINDQAGIVGPTLFYPDGRSQRSHGPLPTLTSEMISLAGFDKIRLWPIKRYRLPDPFETGFVSGACMFVRRSMLQEIGLFDENFFFFSEEVDLCYRAHKAGWKVFFIPFAVAIHIEAGSSGMTANRRLNLYRGKLRYFAKHYGDSAKNQLLIAMRILTTIKVWSYSMLRWVTLGNIARDQFWRIVSAGLSSES